MAEVVGHEDYLVVDLPLIVKATPQEEGGRRFLYCEASNEALDQEGDEILKSALLGTKDFFVANGNVDLDHITVRGAPGVTHPRKYEIGKPREVRDRDRAVLVKNEIYRGADAEIANWFWGTLENQDPPMSWFPSIGAKGLAAKKVWDPELGQHRRVITKALWYNLAFSARPQNLSVPAANTYGYQDYLKSVRLATSAGACEGDACCDSCLSKALTAGAGTPGGGTDVAQLVGGAALRRQSLDRGLVDPFRPAAARYLAALGTGDCDHTHPTNLETIHAHFRDCEGMDEVTARRSARRIVNSLRPTRRQAAA